METLDWLVIGIFFLALIGIIVWVVKQKQNDSADYFLGGRDATWLAIGASIFGIQHRFRTFNRTSRCRCFQRYGDGTLGNTRLDDPYLRLGIRTVLFAKHGIHDA